MRGALGGPRVLLRRLREVMAEPVSAQDRLDKIVVLIAANMVAEVCSVYVLRGDSTLELFATEGLKREAVHQTVMRSDEGLVGLVASQASPINLSNAQAHPAFSSAMKYYGTELNKRRYEILMSAGGIDALEWESERSRGGARPRAWLRTKANSIEGGTSEVMLGIVAKRILDLPGA